MPDNSINAYTEALDGLRFTEETKRGMAANLVAAVREQERNAEVADFPTASDTVRQASDTRRQAPDTRRQVSDTIPTVRKRSPLRLVAAFVGILFALALGVGGIAYATGNLVGFDELFGQLFGGSADPQATQSVGHTVVGSANDAGITITADAVLGDSQNFAIVFTITKDDGTPFDISGATDSGLLPYSLDSDLDVPHSIFEAWGMTGSAYFYDADPSDNSIQLVETRTIDSADVTLLGKTVTVRLSNLMRFDENGAGETWDGRWTFSIPIDYEDTSIEFTAGQDIEVNGMSAHITRLTVSPVAFHIDYTVDALPDWENMNESGRMSEHDSGVMDRFLGLGDVTIVMKDGSTCVWHDMMGGAISENTVDGTTDVSKGDFLPDFIDTAQVDHVEICGVSIYA